MLIFELWMFLTKTDELSVLSNYLLARMQFECLMCIQFRQCMYLTAGLQTPEQHVKLIESWQ